MWIWEVENSNFFQWGAVFIGRIFTGELSRVDSAGTLKQDISMKSYFKNQKQRFADVPQNKCSCSNIRNFREIRQRAKNCRASEIITCVWGSELRILLHHLLSSKVFFLLIYVTRTLCKAYFDAIMIMHWHLESRKTWNYSQESQECQELQSGKYIVLMHQHEYPLIITCKYVSSMSWPSDKRVKY